MKYIAIKDDSFILITPDIDENILLYQGFELLTEIEYKTYIDTHNAKSVEETLKFLEDKADEYIAFGETLWNIIKKKVFAINTYNKSQGNDLTIDQMKALLATSDMLEKSLKSGSLNTSKDIANYFKATMPQYSTVCNFIISEINVFMGLPI